MGQKTIFRNGPISPAFVAEQLEAHEKKQQIGAHQLFFGQVRADPLPDGSLVKAIEYTAYEEMANQKLSVFREELFAKHKLSCLHVYHSLGLVPAGKLCLLIFVSSPHRTAAMHACTELVEYIKSELPIWGKELGEESHQWKINLAKEK